MRTVTFLSILDRVALAVGLTYGTAQAADLERWASYANTFMNWVWRCPNRMFAFDFSVEVAEEIAVTDGSFAASEIDDSDWWNLWTQDPRPYQVSGGTWPNIWPLRVRAFQDADGIWPQTTQATVFAFYRKAQPKFTSTAVVGATTYAAGSVVYDATSGDCYVALVSALGSAIADTAKWERQLVPEVLSGPLGDFIEAKLNQMLGQLDKKRDLRAEAEQWVDLEMMRQMPRNGSGPPWAYNGAGNYYDMAPGYAG